MALETGGRGGRGRDLGLGTAGLLRGGLVTVLVLPLEAAVCCWNLDTGLEGKLLLGLDPASDSDFSAELPLLSTRVSSIALTTVSGATMVFSVELTRVSELSSDISLEYFMENTIIYQRKREPCYSVNSFYLLSSKSLDYDYLLFYNKLLSPKSHQKHKKVAT